MLPTARSRQFDLVAHRSAFFTPLADQLDLHRVRSLREVFTLFVLPHLFNIDVDGCADSELGRGAHAQPRVFGTADSLVDDNIAVISIVKLGLDVDGLLIAIGQRSPGYDAHRSCVLLEAFLPDV